MTFVSTATSGRKRSIASSWNEDTSQTKSRGAASSDGTPRAARRCCRRARPGAAPSAERSRRSSASSWTCRWCRSRRPSGSRRAPRPRRCATRSRSPRDRQPRRAPRRPPDASAGPPGESASQSAPSSRDSVGRPRRRRTARPAARRAPRPPRTPPPAGRRRRTLRRRASSRASASARPLRANPRTRRPRQSGRRGGEVVIAALIAASASRAPSTAKRMARIQKRMMTRDSAQPASSKWWCSGAIRKTRLPVELERSHLDDHRERLERRTRPPTITSSISCFDHHRDGAERGAERERADVAHEDVGRVAVVPEEAEEAPTSAPQNTASSPAWGMYAICR